MIRVGRRIYNKDGSFTDPSFPGFKSIICLTKSTPYGSLGPYVLKNSQGHIMENIWQFSKIYKNVPATKERYSRYDQRVIWEHPAEIHTDQVSANEHKPNEYYKKWRAKGFSCPDPIRYPVGHSHRKECLGAITESELEKCSDPEYVPKLLNYVESRKEIYLKVYHDLVIKEPKFLKLLEMLKKGVNILIIEVDGPHQEDLDYYKEKYNVPDEFIINHTMLVTKENLDIMLNDTRHPFGHCYCLAMSLLEQIKINT
jgi:hypothetical protein